MVLAKHMKDVVVFENSFLVKNRTLTVAVSNLQEWPNICCSKFYKNKFYKTLWSYFYSM